MIDKNTGKGSDFTTVIGADAVFKGELSFDKGVRVDGRIEGKISTKGNIAVSQAGKLEADVNAGAIVVEGSVKGNLDIIATKLIVTEGATFNGHCKVGPNAGAGGTTSGATGGTVPTNRVAGKEAAPRR